MEQFQPVLRRLEELLSESENASLNKMLTLWAATALKRAGFVEESRKFRNLQEVNMIFGKAALESAANWKNVYIQEGREEGREEGVGEALRILLKDRLGTIPDSVISYIEEADFVSLTALLHFAIRAESLQAITAYINDEIDTADSLEESCHSDRDV